MTTLAWDIIVGIIGFAAGAFCVYLGARGAGVTRAQLSALFGATNEVLAGLRIGKRPELMESAVNWSRVSCYAAEFWTSDLGHRGLRVWIQEASPDAIELVRAVAEELTKRGYPRVEVVTEW